MYKTFDEWSAAGYTIKKGSKAVYRNLKGKCMFSENQVKRNTYSFYNHHSTGDWQDPDYDDMDSSLAYGGFWDL